MTNTTTPWWRDRAKLTFGVFLAIAAYFLWTEHQAHVIEFLPWVLILGCVGMHLFMHGGHDSHGHGGAHDNGSDGAARNLPDNDSRTKR
jgi:hypothetical protein